MAADDDASRPPDFRGLTTHQGVDYEFHRYNGPSGSPRPSLVFLHEGLGSTSMWRDFPGRLASTAGMQAIVYSRRGYGQSSPRQAAYDVDFMHREAWEVLPALLTAWDIEKPILVGHSDGASIALIHAARHPVTALALEAPHIFVEGICVDAIAEIKPMFQTTDLAAKLGRHHLDAEHAFRGWNDIWLLPAFRDWNIEALLGSVTCPVLAIQGENDQYGTMAQIDGIAARAGGSVDLLKLAECGHSPHRDQADQVLNAMSSFIAGLKDKPLSENATEGRYLEDYAADEVIVSRSYTLGRREIMAFAEAYDPQPIHLDEVFASTKGPYRSIIASGFQTVSLAFKLFAESGFFDGGVSLGGPGMDNVRWHLPAFPGDVLTNRITVANVRRSNSKPDRGVLTLAHDLSNQDGESVTTFTTTTFIKARGPEAS